MVRIKLHRQLPARYVIKHVTISKTSTNKYYVSILVQYELNVKENQLNIENSLGLDYSSHDFYVDSNGVRAEYPRYFRLYQNTLAKEQRKLSSMKLGSNNYKKQKLKVAKVYEKIANLRNDFLHKLSTQLANNHDYIFVEDIDLRAMSQCLKLGKSTLDNSFGKFRTLLEYKIFERGKIFHKIDKW
jgi:putative transposase